MERVAAVAALLLNLVRLLKVGGLRWQGRGFLEVALLPERLQFS